MSRQGTRHNWPKASDERATALKGRQVVHHGRAITLLTSAIVLTVAMPPGQSATAQTRTTTERADAPAAQTPSVAEVVVSGQRSQPGDAIGSPVPLTELSPEDIDAFGAASVTELMDAIKLEAKGAGDDPIYLVNGRRVSGFAVMGSLPPEAIARVQVLPEAEALRYGYPATQRVVNVVLKDPFRGLTADGAGEMGSEGGALAEKADVGSTDVAGNRRISVDLSLEQDSDLRASERGVVVPPASTSSIDGAPGPASLAPDESLRPWQQKGTLSAVVGQPFGAVDALLDASFATNHTRSEQGLAQGTLTVPPQDPFARSTQDEVLSGEIPEGGPLIQSARSSTGHVGLSLDAPLKTWTWSLTASEDHTQSDTRTGIGFDLSQAQLLLNEGSPNFDPFSPLPVELLTAPVTSRATSTLDDAVVDSVFDGEVAVLPAGRLSATFKVGGNFTREISRAVSTGLDQSETLQREQELAEVIVTAPIANRDRGVLAPLGSLSANLDLAVDNVSDFGLLRAIKAGFSWSPSAHVSVHGQWSTHQDAPKPQDLDAPTIVTPNVSIYDYRVNETVLVTELSGGNPQLKADRVRGARFNLDYTPSLKVPLDFFADWSHSDTRDQVTILPIVTADIEAAFPDRFIRDSSGDLVEIDARSINLTEQVKDQLAMAMVFQSKLPPKVPGARGGRVFLAINDAWTLHDTVLIRPGVPPINLLQGGAVAFAGGQPAHVSSLSAGFAQSGVGLFLSGKRISSTELNNGTVAANLSYSALTTLNLRTYLDFASRSSLAHQKWAQGLRLTFGVTNLFDTRQTVRNGLDQTPLAFQGPYLDPVGRLLHIEFRKSLQ
jgi:iron complex outermembrane recepter protein